ncbi:chromo domain protein LHP1 isoform X2 [Lycium barbarum]|uniref:chromo domain protein LHP1 isoform X2 n=1 Tax=Lycium barbarum TaxID=112863 RepID=UPI00293F51F4|nr:chromo domain protein LHP1 isoform X2 [Lycium barbarum]
MKGGKKKSSGIQAATDTPKPPAEPAGAGEASEHEKRDEYAASDGEEEEEEEEDEDEEEKTYEELQIEQVDVGEAETERPKLAEGFYEIEAVRRKRVRKGQVQYLIKWRGWPETENTWEPVKNLMSCSDVIDAFEESSQSGKQRSTRKRKRKVGATQTQPKKKQQQQQQSSPAAATYNVPAVKVRIIEEPTPSPLPSGLKSTNRVNNIGGVLNSKVDKVVNETDLRLCFSLEETGEQNELNLKLSELKGSTSTNENPMDRSGNGLSNGFAKVNGAESNQSDRCTGAKKRKSGSVRRFKQDTTSAVVDDVQDALAGGALATFLQEGSHNHEFVGSDLVCRNKPDDSNDAYTITQLIKPISYSASLSNDVQDVSVTFRAKSLVRGHSLLILSLALPVLYTSC